VFDGPIGPEAGAVLTFGGKEVGQVTRAAAPPDLPHAIGMGYLRKEAYAAGTQLDWSGGKATVGASTAPHT
jgi:glycine cleavage system aminomethyltransferase T